MKGVAAKLTLLHHDGVASVRSSPTSPVHRGGGGQTVNLVNRNNIAVVRSSPTIPVDCVGGGRTVNLVASQRLNGSRVETDELCLLWWSGCTIVDRHRRSLRRKGGRT